MADGGLEHREARCSGPGWRKGRPCNVHRNRHNEKIQFGEFLMVQIKRTPRPLPGEPDEAGAGRRVYRRLRALLADGSLAPGAALPSTRSLAADLAVARGTVTNAYEQLAAEGYIVTAAGRAARVAVAPGHGPDSSPRSPSPRRSGSVASIVSAASVGPGPQTDDLRRAGLAGLSAYARRVEALVALPAASHPPARIDFLYGAVAASDFPTLAWRRSWQRELLQQPVSRYYAPAEGEPALRQALQGYLRRARGLRCTAEQILIVNGSQQALDLCARLLLAPGDAFAFEDPGYVMARNALEATGARLIPVPVDDQGLQTAQLPGQRPTRLVYVTPSHQFPLGGVLSVGRRRELLAWARRHGAWVIEDDYDGEFRYGQRPIDALQAIDDDGRVIYAGTFSKALSPQLRLGYLVLPPPLVVTFAKAKRLMDRHTAVLDQRAIARLIDNGLYERHVRRVRRGNERRRAALLGALAAELPQARLAGSAAGLHVVLWLPSLAAGDGQASGAASGLAGTRPAAAEACATTATPAATTTEAARIEAALVDAARKAGVGVYPLSPLYADQALAHDHPAAARPPGLTLGYASLSADQIVDGVRVLARVVRSMQRRARTAPARAP